MGGLLEIIVSRILMFLYYTIPYYVILYFDHTIP